MERVSHPVLGPDVSEFNSALPDQTLYDVAALDDLHEGEVFAVTLKGQAVALVRRGGVVHAVGGRCPHKGATFRGKVSCHSSVHGDVIVCPWHKAVFGVCDGRVKEPVAFSPLPVYPVRLVEGRVLVGAHPITPRESAPRGEGEAVVVLGGGAAAASALYTLRTEGFAGSLILIGDEGSPPYERPALSKGIFLGDPDKVKAPLLLDEDFYAHYSITRVRGSVTSLDCQARNVTLEDGRTYQAEHILVTTGGKPTLPDVPGIRLDGVLALHSIADARRIARDINGDQAVILIGGGLTTLETASALRQKGAGVTLISPDHPIPMQGQWGREVGLTLLGLHEANSVAFVHDAHVVRIYGDGRVEGVELSDGMKLPCTHVIYSIGNEPNCSFMPGYDEYGVRDDGVKGIPVDEDMCVAPGIYAAGDVAALRRKGGLYRIEHWRPAQCEGRMAARSILGLPRQPMAMPWYWTQQFGKKLEYLGWGEAFDYVVIEGSLREFDFMAVYIKGDRVVALVSAGRATSMARAAVDFEGFVAKEISIHIV